MPPVPARAVVDLLGSWLPRQRWYAAKGTPLARVEPIARFVLGVPDPVQISVELCRAHSADGTWATYQVPVTRHPVPRPELEHALIGVLESADGERSWLYDGPHDRVYVTALSRLLGGVRSGSEASSPDAPGGDRMWGTAAPEAVEVPSGTAAVLRGEQSNTSIIVAADGPTPVIIKLFRVVQPGDNPDVVVQSRLAAAGCDRVAHPVGWVEGTWSGTTGEPVRGHLAYACEFLPGARDAWRVACEAVSAAIPFDAQARGLGEATAAVHAVLATAGPTRVTDAAVLGELADALIRRVHWALDQVPDLAVYGGAALDAMDAVRTVKAAPDLQWVHGDYHLGQVLHTADRGWVLLDFEGEPLRPLAERSRPDLALRDLAGMLRSFDYASRQGLVGLPGDDPRARAAQRWAARAREAFLDGYAAAAGHDPREHPVLLRALELDKAIYETVYETGNRPDWLPIPMAAVRRLCRPDRTAPTETRSAGSWSTEPESTEPESTEPESTEPGQPSSEAIASAEATARSAPSSAASMPATSAGSAAEPVPTPEPLPEPSPEPLPEPEASAAAGTVAVDGALSAS